VKLQIPSPSSRENPTSKHHNALPVFWVFEVSLELGRLVLIINADDESVRESLRVPRVARNTSLLLVAGAGGTGEKLWLGFAPKYIDVLGTASCRRHKSFWSSHFRCAANFSGRDLRVSRRLAHGPLGQRKSLLLFSAISITGYVSVLVWQSWLALLLGAFLFLAWSALSLPATLSVIATSLQSNRHTMGVACNP